MPNFDQNGCSWEMFFAQEVIKNTMFYNDVSLKHHHNLGFQLLLDQFCEGQAYNSFEEILQNQKTKTKVT